MTRKDDLFEEHNSNDEGAAAEPAADTAAPYTGETPGQILRAAREAKGLSTQQVADSLRLRNAVVEMIEADDYEKLSSPTFVRGYLRSFSKALEVDEKRVFEAYRAMGFGEVAASTITMQSFSKRKVRERDDSRLMLISYLIIAIVIAMAVIWWWQDSSASSSADSLADQVLSSEQADNSGSNSDTRTPVTRRVTEDDVRSTITSADEAATDDDASADDASAGGALVTATDARIGTNADSDAGTDVGTDGGSESNEGATNSDAGATTSDASNSSANDELVITFSDACWVKVTDGVGEVIAIGTKVAGYTMPLSGQAPFDIILCKPEAVSMTYNGEQVDLSGYRRSRSVTMTLN